MLCLILVKTLICGYSKTKRKEKLQNGARTGTAKDWWRAERKNIDAWKTFKEKFLFAFLNEDFKEVAAQRLVNRRQQIKKVFGILHIITEPFV